MNPRNIAEIKIQLLNYYGLKDKDEFQLKDNYNKSDIIERIDNLTKELYKHTICDDQYTFDSCGINVSHKNIMSILKKYEFSEDGKMNVSIDNNDLRVLIYMVVNYVDYINNKPVFIMRLKNEMRKNNNDVNSLPKDLLKEIEGLSKFVYDKGIVDYLYLEEIKKYWID